MNDLICNDGMSSIRGRNVPLCSRLAVETTAKQRNPTSVGLKKKEKKPIFPVLIFFFNPTEVGFRGLAVVSTARQTVIRGRDVPPRSHLAAAGMRISTADTAHDLICNDVIASRSCEAISTFTIEGDCFARSARNDGWRGLTMACARVRPVVMTEMMGGSQSRLPCRKARWFWPAAFPFGVK